MAKTISFHAARKEVAQTFLKKIGPLVTEVLGEITCSSNLDIKDQFELVEAVVNIAGDLTDRLEWLYDYHDEKEEQDRQAREGGQEE